MLINQIAERYAKSLLELAIENKIVEKVLKDMYTLQDMINESKEFKMLMRSPVVSFHKKDTIWKLLSKTMTTTTQLFISLLIRKNREFYLEAIIASFIEQKKTHEGVVDMTIYSAITLDKKVIEHIEKIVKKEISTQRLEIENKVDSSLIGGFVLQIKDQVVDLSIAKKLKDIEKQILAQ